MTNENKTELKEIERPIHSDFVIENANGLQGQDGKYYHYSEVVSLLKKWDTRPNAAIEKALEHFKKVKVVVESYDHARFDNRITTDFVLKEIITKIQNILKNN
jgi:hypothetical protein